MVVDSVGIRSGTAGQGLVSSWWLIAFDHLRSWLVSEAQAASCSAGVRIPMAECGRMVPVPVDPLGGGELGGVDVLPGALAKG